MLMLGPYDAALVANGARPRRTFFQKLMKQCAHLVSIDGGLAACRKMRCKPDVLIGDLDSVQAADISWAKRRHITIVRRPNQNSTDLEKAAAYAHGQGWRRVAVLAASGNRPDHYLNGLGLAFRVAGLQMHFYLSGMLVLPISGRAVLDLNLKDGHTVSWFGFPSASGCEISGVKWPVKNRTLRSSGFQSVSNLAEGPMHVRQQRGRSLLMISLIPESSKR